jgi:hypothetical protein
MSAKNIYDFPIDIVGHHRNLLMLRDAEVAQRPNLMCLTTDQVSMMSAMGTIIFDDVHQCNQDVQQLRGTLEPKTVNYRMFVISDHYMVVHTNIVVRMAPGNTSKLAGIMTRLLLNV